MKQTEGGVLAAKGYRAAAAAAEIKYRDRDDMALIFSDVPAAAAGVFTLNQVKAAPVLWDREIIKEGRQVRAIVANAGIANACTGTQGREDCAETARALARPMRGRGPPRYLTADMLPQKTRAFNESGAFREI